MTDLRRVATASGVAAPAIAIGAILLSTLLSPSFSWTRTALSHVGAAGQPTAPLFNGGLVLGGVVGLPFVWRLWVGSANHFQRAGSLLFGVSVLAMVLVGVFPTPESPHFPAAVGHYLSFTLGLWAFGAGQVRAGKRRRGLASATAGVVHIGAWICWGVALSVTGAEAAYGFAIMEFFGALVFGGWLVVTAWTWLGPDGGPAAGTAGDGE